MVTIYVMFVKLYSWCYFFA